MGCVAERRTPLGERRSGVLVGRESSSSKSMRNPPGLRAVTPRDEDDERKLLIRCKTYRSKGPIDSTVLVSTLSRIQDTNQW